MSEATACVLTALGEFASASCTVMPVKDEPEPFAEAGTDVFDELTAAFAGKVRRSEVVRTFVCNSKPSSPRRTPSAVSNETARRAHQACFMYEWRREKSEHFSRFLITIPPPLRRGCPCKTGINTRCFETHKRQPQPLKNSAVESCLCAFSSLYSSAALYEERSQLLHVRLPVCQG